MSSTDKARDKLVASMRQTKAGSTDKTAGTSQASGRKTTSRKTGKGRQSAARKTSTPHRRVAAGDPYQGGRRVWPD